MCEQSWKTLGYGVSFIDLSDILSIHRLHSIVSMEPEREHHSRKASHRFLIFRKFFDLASSTSSTDNTSDPSVGVSFLQFNNALKTLTKQAKADGTSPENLDRVHDIALSTFKDLDSDNDGILTRSEVENYGQKCPLDEDNKSDLQRRNSMTSVQNSPLGIFLMHHLKSASRDSSFLSDTDDEDTDEDIDALPIGPPPSGPPPPEISTSTTSASLLNLDLALDDASSDGDLGDESDENNEKNNEINTAPGEDWSAVQLRASLAALDNPDTRQALLIVERSKYQKATL